MAMPVSVVLALVLAASLATSASAQPTLQSALALYAAASYDDALRSLDALGEGTLDASDRAVVAQHRMLCLMALGQTEAAEAAAAAVIEHQPTFTLSAREASPRVRALFEAQRQRLVPARARKAYAEAKQAYDAGAFAEARDGFTTLAAWLAADEVSGLDASLADLRTLTDGFAALSAAALERQSAARDLATVQAAMAAVRDPRPLAAPPAPLDSGAAQAVAAAPAATAPAPVAGGAPPPFTPLDIYTYDWRSPDVVPPTPIDQPLSGWWGSMGEPAPGTRLGVVDVTVDATGRVTDVAIYQSVNRVYDAVLLESVRRWKYQPATRGGRPVKYRRVMGVVSGAPAAR